MKYFLEPSGVVYLAAKSYYFGVGGSVVEFREFVITDGYFDVNEVASFGSGHSSQDNLNVVCETQSL